MLTTLALMLASPSPLRFQPLAPVQVGPMPTRPVLVDMDADGDLDVVLACGPCCGRDPDPRSGHLQVLFNDGRGALSPRRTPIKLLDSALGVAVGDINNDGRPDAVAFHHASYEAGVLLGDGAGGLGRPSYFTLHRGASPHVHSLVLADVNHDGNLDVLATLVDDHALSVHLGDGKGGFTPALAQPYFAHRHPYAQLNIHDLNHDTHPDALLTDVRGNGLTVLSGSGTGMFASSRGFSLEAHTPVTLAERPMAAAVGDVDNDADPDAILAIEEAPQAVLMLNDGSGEFLETGAALELAAPTTGVTLADLNNDGALDLVSDGAAGRAFGCRLGLGDGRFGPPQRVDSLGEDPSVSVGDMNGDGRPDVVAANYDSGTVVVLLGQAD
ncbi:MAG: FG-GAP repeat domain-containing protein [Phycisphaerales bacterium JB059]